MVDSSSTTWDFYQKPSLVKFYPDKIFHQSCFYWSLAAIYRTGCHICDEKIDLPEYWKKLGFQALNPSKTLPFIFITKLLPNWSQDNPKFKTTEDRIPKASSVLTPSQEALGSYSALSHPDFFPFTLATKLQELPWSKPLNRVISLRPTKNEHWPALPLHLTRTHRRNYKAEQTHPHLPLRSNGRVWWVEAFSCLTICKGDLIASWCQLYWIRTCRLGLRWQASPEEPTQELSHSECTINTETSNS